MYIVVAKRFGEVVSFSTCLYIWLGDQQRLPDGVQVHSLCCNWLHCPC